MSNFITMYFCQHLPFHSITDSELRAAVKGDAKLDFDKYCDMKLVLNEESGDDGERVRCCESGVNKGMLNKCKYCDVSEFISSIELAKRCNDSCVNCIGIFK